MLNFLSTNENFLIIFFNREPQWSGDEKICAMRSNNSVIFFEDNNFSKVEQKITMGNVAKFSVAPGNAPYHILCNMPGEILSKMRYL